MSKQVRKSLDISAAVDLILFTNTMNAVYIYVYEKD